MAYTTRQAIKGLIPPDILTEALDDDRDGQEDPGNWEAVLAAACEAVDSRLGSRYDTPFADPVPAIVAEGAKVFVLELLHARRGATPEANPLTAQANAMRKRLEGIGEGRAPLVPELSRKRPPISIIQTKAGTVAGNGRLNA